MPRRIVGEYVGVVECQFSKHAPYCTVSVFVAITSIRFRALLGMLLRYMQGIIIFQPPAPVLMAQRSGGHLEFDVADATLVNPSSDLFQLWSIWHNAAPLIKMPRAGRFAAH